MLQLQYGLAHSTMAFDNAIHNFAKLACCLAVPFCTSVQVVSKSCRGSNHQMTWKRLSHLGIRLSQYFNFWPKEDLLVPLPYYGVCWFFPCSKINFSLQVISCIIHLSAVHSWIQGHAHLVFVSILSQLLRLTRLTRILMRDEATQAHEDETSLYIHAFQTRSAEIGAPERPCVPICRHGTFHRTWNVVLTFTLVTIRYLRLQTA